jgi:hydrogenase-4 component B
MALTIILASALAFLFLSALSLALHARPLGRVLVYGGSLVIAGADLAVALNALVSQTPTETLTLPVGLPGLGAHFRLDTLSAFFLAVVDLGAAAASLFATISNGLGLDSSRLRAMPTCFW